MGMIENIRDVENRLCNRIDALDAKFESYMKEQRAQDAHQFDQLIAQGDKFRADMIRIIKISLGVFSGVATVISAIVAIKGV